MPRLWGYIYRYRVRYLRGIGCLVASASLAMSIPLLLKRAIEAIEKGLPFRQLSLYLLAIIGVALVQGVVRAFSRFLIFNVGRDIEYDLRNDLFAHLQKLSLNYYQSQFIGDLMSRLVNDVTAVRMLLGLGIINILNTPLYYVYAVSAMVAIDPRLTLAALAPYPLARRSREPPAPTRYATAYIGRLVSVSPGPTRRGLLTDTWLECVGDGALVPGIPAQGISLA